MAEAIDNVSVSSGETEEGRGEGRLEASDVEEKQVQGSTGENLLAIGSSNEEGSTVAEEHLQFFAIEDGELTGGEDSAHNSSDLESNTELQRELLSTRSDDDQLRLIVTATQHESQEQVNRLEVELQEMKKENLIHQVEFGRRSFLEDKQKRSEKIFRTSREYFLKKNRKDSAASHLEEYFSIGAGLLHVLEPRSCPPTGHGTLDTVIPVDPLPVRHDKPPDEIHLHSDQANDSMSGVSEAGASCNVPSGDSSAQIESSAEEHTRFPGSNNGSLLSNESSSVTVGSSEKSVVIPQPFSDLLGGEGTLEVSSGAVSVPDPFRLSVDGLLSNVNMHSNEWERLGARPKDRQPIGGGTAVLPVNADCDDLFTQIESIAEEHTHSPDSNNGSLFSDESSSAIVGSSENSLVIRQPFSDLSGVEGTLVVCSGAVSVPPFRLPSLSNVSMHSNEWECLGARPKDRQPKQTLSVEPSEPNVTGISNACLLRHSEDWGLLDSIQQESEQNVLSYDGSFPGVLYMEQVTNYIESNMFELYTVDCHVPSWSAPFGGGAVGGSPFSESLYRNTGIVPPSTSNRGCQPSASTGNLALVDTENSGFLFPYPVSRSCGADRGLLSEEEGSGINQYAVENGDQQSANVGTHSAELLDLRHGVQDLCALVEQLRESEELEQERERRSGERETQEATPEQAAYRPFEAPLPCTIESLDCNHNCVPEFWQDVAQARARIEEPDGEAASASIGARARRWCTCASEVSLEGSICRRCLQHRYLGPSSEPEEHCCTCCVCLEMNEESHTGGERNRPETQHDECCICLEDAFSGCCILPCSHKVHLECYIGTIRNGEFDCPFCGQPFLRWS